MTESAKRGLHIGPALLPIANLQLYTEFGAERRLVKENDSKESLGES